MSDRSQSSLGSAVSYGTNLTPGEKRANVIARVYVDRSRVGSIYAAVDGSGFFYSASHTSKGETLPTVDAVKRSLEAA
jgi:hypothetical protein